MSRQQFSRSNRGTSPLMTSNSEDFNLDDLSPRPFRSTTASPSPPPSFYRSKNHRGSSTSPAFAKSTKLEFDGPPPPITASIHTEKLRRDAEPSRSLIRPSSSSDRARGTALRATHPYFVLQRREKAIQDELQLLLDAQSAGLLRGFGGNPEIERSSDAGSATPTTRSTQENVASGVKPVRQPKKKQIGLKKARITLLHHMQQLIEIKQEQDDILAFEIERRVNVLGQVDLWEKRIEAAKAQLENNDEAGSSKVAEGTARGRENDHEGREISELRAEERAVSIEVRELEDRLAQMKAKGAWLRERINESVNKRDAELSSYRGALREVEMEIKGFLDRPPLTGSIVELDGQNFMSLPTKRRTLSMAKEWWGQEIAQLELRRQNANVEVSALEEGASIWQDCIGAVTEFESDLRRQILEPLRNEREVVHAQYGKMGKVVQLLQKNTRLAEDKGWNLLICAVGAELAAFQEGQEILKAALEVEISEAPQSEGVGVVDHESGESEPPRELRNGLGREESSEDEGPNLEELLIDHAARDARD